MQRVEFKTSDGVRIVGSFWRNGENGILLLHMMPATKESWNDLAEILSDSGFSVLAIDLRGHGESGGGNYRLFTDAQHQASIHDVDAASLFLRDSGVTLAALCGASIGANLALAYQSQHSEILKTVLLSPGTNYRGILTIPSARKLTDDQKSLIVAGSQDGRSSGRSDLMAQQIAQAAISHIIVEIYDTSAHGTDLFNVDAELQQKLVAWIRE